MSAPKLVRAPDFDADLPSYLVLVDGRQLGTVTRAWFRAGGVAWTNSIGGISRPAGRTRAEAVAHLIRNKLRGVDA